MCKSVCVSRTAALVLVLGACSAAARGQCEQISQELHPLMGEPVAGGGFGHLLGLSGDTMVVGGWDAATQTPGALIFVRSGGAWVQQAVFPMVETDTPGGAAIQGNTVLLGSPGMGTTGSIAVAMRTGTTWSAPMPLAHTLVVDETRFGCSIAMSAIGTRNYAAIGSRGSVVAQGVVSVYTINPIQFGATWQQSASLTASDGDWGDGLGNCVGISGNTIVAGAFNENEVGTVDNGAAYVFTLNVGGVWTQQAKLTSPEPLMSGRFGTAVAISGDSIVVGAPGPSAAGVQYSGRAYIFTRNGAAWTHTSTVYPIDTGGSFGASVAISGDLLAVGAPQGRGGTMIRTGYAAICARPPGSGVTGAWTRQDIFLPWSAESGDSVGRAVAISGMRCFIGAPNAGAVYIVDVLNPCPADFNCSGQLEVADIFAFLNAWFAGSPTADFDGVNGLQVADIFAFLNAWFAGC